MAAGEARHAAAPPRARPDTTLRVITVAIAASPISLRALRTGATHTKGEETRSATTRAPVSPSAAGRAAGPLRARTCRRRSHYQLDRTPEAPRAALEHRTLREGPGQGQSSAEGRQTEPSVERRARAERGPTQGLDTHPRAGRSLLSPVRTSAGDFRHKKARWFFSIKVKSSSATLTGTKARRRTSCSNTVMDLQSVASTGWPESVQTQKDACRGCESVPRHAASLPGNQQM